MPAEPITNRTAANAPEQGSQQGAHHQDAATETASSGPTHTSSTMTSSTRASSTKTRVFAALCTIGCLALMAVVIALAGEQPDDESSKAHSRDFSRDDGSTNGRDGMSDAEVMGTPPGGGAPRGGVPDGTTSKLDLSGCGRLDPDNPPEIAFLVASDGLDLGDLKQGIKLDREVSFKNIGTGPLCVAKVSTGCGCLKATLIGEKKRFEPDEVGTIRLAADTTGRMGRISKQVSIFSNDVKSPRRSFRVTMDVSAGLVSEPRYLAFGNIPPSTEATRTMILRSSKEDKPWKITSIESIRKIAGRAPVKYTFEVEPVQDPRYTKVRVRVKHPGYADLGAIRDVLAITTTHPDRKRIEIPAHIHIVPRILCRSRVISLGYVRAGTPRAPSRARIQAGAPGIVFKILRVEVLQRDGSPAPASGTGFQATFGEDQRGWWVDVKYDGKARGKGLLEGMLHIHTDDKQQPVVKVPVRATVKAAS